MSAIPHHTSDPSCLLCEQKLLQATKELEIWFRKVKSKYPSIHISWSYRDQASQEQAFAEGKTHAHFPHSPHNQMPSLAIDIFQINDKGQAIFDPIFCAKIAEEARQDEDPILWGGIFKSLGDNDHFQFNPHAQT